MVATQKTIEQVEKLGKEKYKYGFVSDIEMEQFPIGLNEDIIQRISAKKNEPEWMTEYRLKAFRLWQKMDEPAWAKLIYQRVDYQSLIYFAQPKSMDKPKSLDEVDPQLLEVYNKLGIPLQEQEVLAGVEGAKKPIAIDAIFDSVSVGTTYKETLAEHGVIFCSIGEALQQHPDLVKKYFGSVVPASDNFFLRIKHRCIYRWIVCVYPQRRRLSYGIVVLFPY